MKRFLAWMTLLILTGLIFAAITGEAVHWLLVYGTALVTCLIWTACCLLSPLAWWEKDRDHNDEDS